MPWTDVALKVYGADVVEVGPGRFPVDGALVQLRVFAGGGVDGIDVNHRHLLVKDLGPRLDQLAGLSVQAGPLEEQPFKAKKARQLEFWCPSL